MSHKWYKDDSFWSDELDCNKAIDNDKAHIKVDSCQFSDKHIAKCNLCNLTHEAHNQ